MTESQLMREIFLNIFLNDVPLIDVRAEVEFEQGAFPAAVNIPILNSDERHCVGISYKEKGPEEAERLGHELVSGEERRIRISRWSEFIDDHEKTFLYCFRGGKRSRIACQWLSEQGKQILRVPGGYKSMRRFLLNQFDALPSLIVVSGKTGVGKTELLGQLQNSQLQNSLDLEGHANHRGSAFGRFIDVQPVQINFENSLAIELLKFNAVNDTQSLFVEDESRLIGKVLLPPVLQSAMKMSPIVLLEDTTENRVHRIYKEYILNQWNEYADRFPDNAFDEFSDYLRTAMDAIRKRLGGAAHQKLRKVLDDALLKQQSGEFEAHKSWIKSLLEDYYDPMYRYQLDKKANRIIFRGDMQDIIDWSRSPESMSKPS
jgi:tRNA 2-selenouridine synthase